MNPWKRRLPLQNKVGGFFALLLVLIVVEWLYSSEHERNALREQMINRGNVLVRTLAQLSEEPLIGLQIGRLEQQLDSILQEKDVRYARIYDANHTALAATDRKWEGWSFSGKIAMQSTLQFGHDLMVARCPILITGRIHGLAEVAFSLASMNAEIGRGQTTFVIIFTCEAILAIVFALLIEIQIARPLEKLSNQVSEITPESLELPLGHFRFAAREILKVESSIDDMRKKLNQAHETVVAKTQLATMGQLAANMTHEIRNPLEAISGAVEILSSETGLKEESRISLSIIQEEIQNLNDYLSEFLEFARPGPVALSRTAINDLVRDCLVLLAPVFHKKHIETQLALQMDLPEATVDPIGLKRVIINLLLNSVEAVEDGGKIRVLTTARGSNLSIAIEDNGRGVPAGMLPRIFDPYFTTKKNGSGIGLALSRKIIEEHGGDITVSSRKGAGTTVVLDVPLRAQGNAHE